MIQTFIVEIFTKDTSDAVRRMELAKDFGVVTYMPVEKSHFTDVEDELKQQPDMVFLWKRQSYLDQATKMALTSKLYEALKEGEMDHQFCRLFHLNHQLAKTFSRLFANLEPVYRDLMTRDAGTESAHVYANTTEGLDLGFDNQQSLSWSFNEGNFPERGELSGGEAEEVDMAELLDQFVDQAMESAKSRFAEAALNVITNSAMDFVQQKEQGLDPKLMINDKSLLAMMQLAFIV